MANEKKIAFLVSSTGWGGLEMNTLKLARLLGEKGYELTLITQEKSTLLANGQNIFSAVETFKKRRKYFDFKASKRLAEIMIKREINLLLVVDNKDLDMAAWCKRRYHKKLRLIYQQHMQIGVNKKDWLHTFRFKAVDTWVSPLPFLKRELALRTKFPLSRVQIVPIGVDTEAFSNRKYEKEEIRQILGIPVDVPVLGIIGRISEKKGQKFVAEAVLQLKNQGLPYHLLIFGSATVNDENDKAYAQSLIEFVQENGLKNEVHFQEAQADTAKFYNAIDVFVLASHSETYGMVTIEAMLNALPILATHSGGTPEILGNGAYGDLYAYEDSEDFIAKLKHLWTNLRAAQERGVKARNHAVEAYSQEKECLGFITVLNELDHP